MGNTTRDTQAREGAPPPVFSEAAPLGQAGPEGVSSEAALAGAS